MFCVCAGWFCRWWFGWRVMIDMLNNVHNTNIILKYKIDCEFRFAWVCWLENTHCHTFTLAIPMCEHTFFANAHRGHHPRANAHRQTQTGEPPHGRSPTGEHPHRRTTCSLYRTGCDIWGEGRLGRAPQNLLLAFRACQFAPWGTRQKERVFSFQLFDE